MRSLPVIAALVASILWGTVYALATEILPEAKPVFLGAMRALPGGLLAMLWVRRLPPKGEWGRVFWLSVFNIGLFLGLIYFAAYRLPGGEAAVIGALNPFFVALLAWPVLHKRPARHTWVAAAAGLIGVAMLVLSHNDRGGPDVSGVFFAVLATASLAPGTVLVKKWCLPASPLTSTAWMLLISGIMLSVVSLILEGVPTGFDRTQWVTMAYLSLIATGLAYFFWFYALDKIKPQIAALLTLATPLTAVLIDWVWLHKPLNGWQIFGGILVSAALVFEGRRRVRG